MFESLNRVTLYVEEEKRVKYDYYASYQEDGRDLHLFVCYEQRTKDAGKCCIDRTGGHSLMS